MARILVATPILSGCLDPLSAHQLIEGEPGSDAQAQALICAPTQDVDAAAQARMPALRVIAVAGARSGAVGHVAAAARDLHELTAGEGLGETKADIAFGLVIAAPRV